MASSVPNPDALSDFESTLVDTIDDEEPWALLEEFEDLNRLSGTADEREAAEYIVNRLESFGVDVRRHDPELYISQPHDATIRTLNKSFEPGPVKTVAFSASTTVRGEVEYVGRVSGGLSADGAVGEEAFADVGDLSGKIALTAAGSLSIRATSILEEKGALGVIAIHEHDREPHNGIATPVWGGAPRLDEKDRVPDVPVVNVNNPDGTTLKEWAESDEGLEMEIETELTTDWFQCPLVEARIEGEQADSDDFVLLHGHYDSWYVGITDNATGDAGLLELARVFENNKESLDRNLRIAWWPAHSTGRYAGSTWYADEFAHELDERCVAQVNMDSPGAADATEYTDMSCWVPEAHPLVGEAIEDVTGAPYEEQFPPRAGDYSFDNLGITGFFMLSSNIPTDERERRGYHEVGGCGGNADAWHLSTDTLDKAGRKELLRDIRLYAVSVARVLNADVLPFDHERNAASIKSAVEEYDDAAGEQFDFSPALDELEDLQSELAEFYERVAAGDIPPANANETIKRLSRVLTRLYLVGEGQFEQDPAVGRKPVPRLAAATRFADLEGDDMNFLQTQLKREQNTVVSEIRRARELL